MHLVKSEMEKRSPFASWHAKYLKMSMNIPKQNSEVNLNLISTQCFSWATQEREMISGLHEPHVTWMSISSTQNQSWIFYQSFRAASSGKRKHQDKIRQWTEQRTDDGLFEQIFYLVTTLSFENK